VVSVMDELSIMDLDGLILLENQNIVTKTCSSATFFTTIIVYFLGLYANFCI